MKHFFLTFLYLTTLQAVFTQKTPPSFLIEKELQNERMRIAHERAMSADVPGRPSKQMCGVATRSVEDTDDDGMPDDWENLYGFDPSNPADAFGDGDADRVINLFEFQLGTSPSDPAAPQVLDVPLTDELGLVLSGVDDQTLIRLQGGTYPLNYVTFVGIHPRIILQGGWNETFTERDICLYPTILDGQNAIEVFYISVSEGQNAAILDGLTLRNGSGIFGSIKFITWMNPVTAYWGLVDCEIVENAPSGTFGGAIEFLHWDTSQVEVTIINTRITNNYNTCGIYNQTTDSSYAKWRIYNSSVAFNDDLDSLESDIGLGIRGFTLDEARLDIKMTNTILWGNDEFDLKFNGFGDSIAIGASRCDIGNTTFLSQVLYEQSPDCINEDPLFADAANGNLTLTTSSPCLDAGVHTGLAFNGPGPDIGATPCLLSVSGVHEYVGTEPLLFVYPNPASDYIKIATEENPVGTAYLSLRDVQGHLLRSAGFNNALFWNVRDLPQGVYWLTVQDRRGTRTGKFLKQ